MKIILPNKPGWYWILTKARTEPMPCWYDSQLQCFLPAGLGDSSSMGIYEEDIERIGPEIIEPTF